MIWPEEWWFKSLGIQRLRDALRTEGEHTTVGIWDTGLDNSQLFFETNRVSGTNYLAGASDDIRDRSGNRHGSEVARIIAANKDHWGIAPRANAIIAKAVAAEGDEAHFEAFDADGGFKDAHIINMSYGYRQDQPRYAAIIHSIQTALSRTDKLVVAAMGNFGDALTTYPAAMLQPDTIIGVNAIDPAGRLYGGSVNGPGVDICAPGTAMQGYFTNRPLVGTSFACAVVSGVSALVHSAMIDRFGNASAASVAALLLECTDQSTQPGPYGKGILNTEKIIKKLTP